jgi:hypothetical protein
VVSARRRHPQGGQTTVEFALIGTTLVLILLVVLDFGRGLLYFTEMATGAREAARQAVLQYNNRSNMTAPGCSPCQVPGVLPQLQLLTGFGMGTPAYALSPASTSPPWYGTYVPAATPGQPGQISLAPAALPNTLYVFIYELNPVTGVTNWATCEPCDGLRTGGGQLVVVDLKMRWQPTVFAFAGGAPAITLDAQTVSREEW